MERVGLIASMTLQELMAWKQVEMLFNNWLTEIITVMKQIESIELMESLNLVE